MRAEESREKKFTIFTKILPAENQVEQLMVLVQLCRNVQHVFVPGQRHCERIAVDDAVERKLVHLVWISHRNYIAHFIDDILKIFYQYCVKEKITSSFFFNCEEKFWFLE